MKKRCFNRTLSFVMSLVLLFAMLIVTPVLGWSDLEIGDANLDGAVNTADVRMILRMALDASSFTTQQKTLADLDGNGSYNTTDARKLLDRLFDGALVDIPLSGVEDVTNSSGYATYTMYAEYTDTYTFSCSAASSISVTTDKSSAGGTTSMSLYILAGEICTVTVKTSSANKSFDLEVTPQEHYRHLPYESDFTIDPDTLDVYGNSAVDPLKAADISYSKREGGTYVYLNNPEKLANADVGKAIERDEGLTGNVQVTWEHSNYSSYSVYLGYQLKNEGSTDVYVTVTNVGLQTTGEWLGQQSWSDYYNYDFALPDDYFTAYGYESSRYTGQGFTNYSAKVYQPTTYRIPAGKYIYVLGGTTSDAYNNTNVGNTANKKLTKSNCSNGVAKFYVSGGEVTGTFYCYSSTAQVASNPSEQGYVVTRSGTDYGAQYKGIAQHQGLIESNLIWYVNDKTAAQDLPVSYDIAYDCMTTYKTDAYQEYLIDTTDVLTRTDWYTNINIHDNARLAVNEDMISFACVTTGGQEVVIDTQHNDGRGLVANLGNWMVDYHDNMTFVNQGSTTRYFTINKLASGALMAMIIDRSGNVLAAECTVSPASGSADEEQWEIYTVEVPAHSVVQVTASFLLMGNSSGSVRHWVTLQ